MERHGIAIDRGTAVHTRQLTTGNGGRGGRSDEDGGGLKKKEKEGKKSSASLVTCRFTSTSLGIIAYMTG